MTTPTTPDTRSRDQIAELRAQLAEAEETLRAIRSGDVDAITVSTPAGEQVYSLIGAEQPYREMIETMSEGAVNITPDGTVLDRNQYFAHLTKFDPYSITGSSLLTYFVDRDRARITSALHELRGVTSRVRAHLLTADGTLVPVNVAMHVLADGGIRSIVIVTSDLTQIVVAQEATTRINLSLEQANRALHMLNLCNTIIIRAADEKQMLSDTCHALVDWVVTNPPGLAMRNMMRRSRFVRSPGPIVRGTTSCRPTSFGAMTSAAADRRELLSAPGAWPSRVMPTRHLVQGAHQLSVTTTIRRHPCRYGTVGTSSAP